MRTRLVIAVMGAWVLGPARGAGAAPVVDERPWAVSPEMTFSFTSVPAYAALGIGVERHFGRYLAFDASLATGLSSAAETRDAEFRLDPWFDVAARVRLQLPVDRRGINSFFLSAGPRLSEGGAYGTLWHGQIEFGYSLHTSGGFSLLYALGTQTPLADREPTIDPATCLVPGCAPTARAGDWAGTFRLGLGYAF
jgi:hypothetical protein